MSLFCPTCKCELPEPYDRQECMFCDEPLPTEIMAPSPAHAIGLIASRLSKGLKHDQGKLPYDLLPFSVIDSIVAVQRFGAAKYGPNNWQRVENGKSRYIAAALRHISAVQQGHRTDDESGLPHLAHALCSLMYAEWIEQQQLKEGGDEGKGSD